MGVPFTDYYSVITVLSYYNYAPEKNTTKDETRYRVDCYDSPLRHHDARSVCREWFPHLHRVEET